jgi:2-oxoglutarate dehydrogenase E2 component (dihydrolipoamide succinyltransferase)
VDITMPQLGETVTEGTITRWLKQVGDQVALDEPLFEVSTDKVDSEVPAAAAGVLTEILVPEGDTVEVGARLAVLGDAADGATAAPAPAAESPQPEPTPAAAAPPPAPKPAPAPPPAPAAAPAPPTPAPAPAAPAPTPAPAAGDERVTSPVVRRLITERGLDPASITGTGEGGRITRRDVLNAAPSAPSAPSAPTARATASPSAPPATATAEAPVSRAVRHGDEVVPFDNIRRRTAEHMVLSKQTSAHVYTSVEVDFERVDRIRRTNQGAWKQEEGFSLTYLPFVVRAFCDAVRDYPNVNASVDGDSLVIHHDVHLGVAVDLEHRGLIAPVIRDADGKRLRLIAREIRDLATRARTKQLGPDEILGGTFTITNMGPFGTLMTLPIINQPQVAILATDGVTKRPVEGPDGDDAIAIHPVGILALAWDHRAFDGAYAAAFLHAVREVLETRDWEAELA